MKNYNVGMEMLDFQNKDFFRNLTYQFSELKKKSASELLDIGASAELSTEIKNFTNLTFLFQIDKNGPCVHIPEVTKNNILVNDIIRSYIPDAVGKTMVEQAGGILSGTVDLAKGKVTGCFTNIQHIIHFPAKMIASADFSAEELAAACLHEVGHIFTYYEYITRTVRTNQVLDGVAKTLSSTNEPKEIEAVLISARKALALDDLNAKQLAKSTNKKVIELVVLTKAVESARSQLGSDIYDINSWEMLADNFAARHGAGRYLVTALDKLQRFNISYRSTGSYIFLEALKLLSLIAGFVFAGTGSILLGRIGFISFISMFTMDLNSEDYDRPGARTKRIRDQVIMRLRDKTISREEREALNSDLKVIDESLAHVNDRLQWFTVLGGFLFRSIRSRYKQERVQQELEYLVSNDLFTLFQDVKRK